MRNRNPSTIEHLNQIKIGTRGAPRTPVTSRDFSSMSWMALAFSAVCLWSPISYAVNYLDPNLGERKDEIARALLNCSTFRGLSDEFKRCLSEHGVTDSTEQNEAFAQARSMVTTGTTYNGPSANGSKEILPADDTTRAHERAPASTRERTR